MKHIVVIGLALALLACNTTEQKQPTSSEDIVKIEGEAQGTTYHISYIGDADADSTKHDIDSILVDVDNSLSTWVPTSLISEINQLDTSTITFDDHFNYFSEVFKYSREVYQLTDGAFDPTIGPLSNAWGFGFKNRENMTPEKVDSLLNFVGFSYDKIRLTRTMEESAQSPERMLSKADAGIQLDFNAIAQGYSVDILGRYLKELGVKAFMIELGGEVLTFGTKTDGDNWKIGIDEPKENATDREMNAILALSNVAVATSGNYRKFYEIDGVKYAHTLNPATGYPVKHGLLSATVITDACWKADAMATAFMVMGPELAISFIEQEKDPTMAVYLIYHEGSDELKTYQSPSMKEFMIKSEKQS